MDRKLEVVNKQIIILSSCKYKTRDIRHLEFKHTHTHMHTHMHAYTHTEQKKYLFRLTWKSLAYYPIYWDRMARSTSVVSDQTPHSLCSLFASHPSVLDPSTGRKNKFVYILLGHIW